MHDIREIEGIGEKYALLLREHGIRYREELLEHCSTRSGRKSISEKCGISPKLIMKWTNQADLARVKGIGEEYAELLERSGVDTVVELSHRNAHNLHLSLKAANDELHLVRQLPSESQVDEWILDAKSLPRVVNY